MLVVPSPISVEACGDDNGDDQVSEVSSSKTAHVDGDVEASVVPVVAAAQPIPAATKITTTNCNKATTTVACGRTISASTTLAMTTHLA